MADGEIHSGPDSDAVLFVITVDGDVPDAMQEELRAGGLFPAGHMGMGRSSNTREGSCTTFFNVFGSDGSDARSIANGVLEPFGRRVNTLEQID